MKVFPSIVVLALFAMPLHAQDSLFASRDLPQTIVKRVRNVLADSATIRYEGATRIVSGRTISGNVAAVGGPLTLAGRIKGDLVTFDGDVRFEPGAVVTGDVTIVGGAARDVENATIGGSLTEYRESEAPAYEPSWNEDPPVDAPWETEDPDWNPSDPWDDPPAESQREFINDAYAKFVIRPGPAYNRVEGLPVRFGPEFGTGDRKSVV